jgi:hypothetical protein
VDDRKKANELAMAMAQLAEGHTALDIFDACTALLAINDVLSGTPGFTIKMGLEKVRGEVVYASEVAKEFMNEHNRLPSMTDLLIVRDHELTGSIRESRLKHLN